MGAPDLSRLESGVLLEIDGLLRELRGSRVRVAVEPKACLEKDLGLGSLERVELLSRLERRFDTKFSERTLREAETPRDLATALLEGVRETAMELSPGEPRRASMAPPEASRSLAEVLVRRASVDPEVPHIFLKEDDAPERTVTFFELYGDALTVAGGLRSLGVGRGDRVAIMEGTRREFFSSFMGSLLVGAVPVPLYPPLSWNRLEEYVSKQANIVNNAEASVFVTLDRALAVGQVLKARAKSLRAIVTVSDLMERSQPMEPVFTNGDDPALIQYTSGSTGDPKGVVLSHENLLANIRAIGETLAITSADVGVSWLPLYHDMGLIGAWLTPLYFGIPVAIFSPVAFLTRPEKWLLTIHARRGTISPAPNFAYELCARKIALEDMEGLDLSSWRVALNGAEPVAADTLERFARKFSPHGFDRASFLPVYGLAEASLLLAAPRGRRPPRVVDFDADALEASGVGQRAAPGARVRRLVSVGTCIGGHDVAIVDPSGKPVGDGVEGDIHFRGPSAMKGYYRNEAATGEIRRANGFLDTGDRGFRFEGELFITGRSKDIIIRAGRNLMPQEIESEVAGVSGVRPGCIAAFGVPARKKGTEDIVIVAETTARDGEARARVEEAIVAAVVDRVGVAPDDVVLVPPRTVPKTSSGKIRRAACRDRYLRGELEPRSARSWTWWGKLGLRWLVTVLVRGARASSRVAFGAYVWWVSAGFVAFGWTVALVIPSRRFLQRFVYRAARLYLALTGIKLEVEGSARLERGGEPFVLVANHASYLDAIPVMATLPFDYAFIVKKEAVSWPVIGTFIRRLGHLPVDRLDTEESAHSMVAMRRLLDEGRSVVLFPEGTFTYATGMRPFKLGGFKLAIERERPLVPVALVGTRRWLRDGSWLPRRVALKVVFAEPRMCDEKSFAGMIRLREETADAIAREVGEPRLDLVAAGGMGNVS